MRRACAIPEVEVRVAFALQVALGVATRIPRAVGLALDLWSVYLVWSVNDPTIQDRTRAVLEVRPRVCAFPVAVAPKLTIHASEGVEYVKQRTPVCLLVA